MNYPLITQDEKKISIEFEPIIEMCKYIPLEEIVMDVNLFNEIIGVEIINAKFQLGTEIFNKLKIDSIPLGKSMSVAYDEVSDALYLCMVNDRSSDQGVASGQLIIHLDGRLIGLVIDKEQ